MSYEKMEKIDALIERETKKVKEKPRRVTTGNVVDNIL